MSDLAEFLTAFAFPLLVAAMLVRWLFKRPEDPEFEFDENDFPGPF